MAGRGGTFPGLGSLSTVLGLSIRKGFSFLMCVLVHTHACAWSVKGVCQCAGHVFTDVCCCSFQGLLVNETQNNINICRETGVQGRQREGNERGQLERPWHS